MNQDERLCPSCKATFPATADYFQRDRNQKCGLVVYCKPCSSIKRKERYAKNPEKWRQKQREYSMKSILILSERGEL